MALTPCGLSRLPLTQAQSSGVSQSKTKTSGKDRTELMMLPAKLCKNQVGKKKIEDLKIILYLSLVSV